MREKPILFSTPMVQAIFVNRKIKTRRLNNLMGVNQYPERWKLHGFSKDVGTPYIATFKNNQGMTRWVKCPWEPGDILWVRETWCRMNCSWCEGDFNGVCQSEADENEGCYMYRATHYITGDARWRPSIFMPRTAARLFLKVTNIRVERLQDINEEDAIVEGTSPERALEIGGEQFTPTFYDPDGQNVRPNYKDAFSELWSNINAKRGYGWDTNPWVWVIEFERVDL